MLDLGYPFLSAHNFTGVSQTLIEGVMRELPESCSMGMLNGEDVVYSPAEHCLMAISLLVGARLQSACSAVAGVAACVDRRESDRNFSL